MFSENGEGNPLIDLTLPVFLLLVTECASWHPVPRATRIDHVVSDVAVQPPH